MEEIRSLEQQEVGVEFMRPAGSVWVDNNGFAYHRDKNGYFVVIQTAPPLKWYQKLFKRGNGTI